MWEIMNNPEGKKVIVNRVNVYLLKCPELTDLVCKKKNVPAATLEKNIKQFEHLPEPVSKGKITDVTVTEKGIISFMLTLESREEANKLIKAYMEEKDGKRFRVLPLTLEGWEKMRPNRWGEGQSSDRLNHCRMEIKRLTDMRKNNTEKINKILQSGEKNIDQNIAKLLRLNKFLSQSLKKPDNGKTKKRGQKRKTNNVKKAKNKRKSKNNVIASTTEL